MKKLTLLLVAITIVFSGALMSQNLIENSSFEDQTPAFWAPLNGTLGTELGVESTEANVFNGLYSFKITKAAATTNPVGWLYEHPVNMFWAGSEVATYALTAMVKTEGVNTTPADDDAKIGVTFEFLDASGNALVAATTLFADQTTASADWDTLAGLAVLTTAPTTIRVTQFMGKNATGTVYLDDVNSNWKVFNSGAETVEGWLNWYAGDNGSYGTVTNNDANTGSYAAELYKPDTTSSTSEIVYYSVPAAVEVGEWYKVGFWAKTVDVNDSTTYEPSYILKERLDERIGITYFFHTGNIETEWSTLGGDKFVYIDQTTDSTGWTHYMVAEQAPEGATGISVRARFTSNPTGLAYFDDFSVNKMVLSGGDAIENNESDIGIPGEFLLMQNYPNPFNPSTTISFYVLEQNKVNISIYNVLGQKVKTLVNANYSKGFYNQVWNGRSDHGNIVSTGLYIYIMNVGDKQFAKKMAFIK